MEVRLQLSADATDQRAGRRGAARIRKCAASARAAEKTRKQVAFITAECISEMKDQANAAGAVAFLTKSFTAETMQSVLGKVLDSPSSRTPLPESLERSAATMSPAKIRVPKLKDVSDHLEPLVGRATTVTTSAAPNLAGLAAELKAVFAKPCDRFDVRVEIDGYGGGQLTILTAKLA